jgi:hypothetical protein
MTPKKTPTGQTFSERLQQLMEEHDPPLGIKELADTLQISYEHTRKMARGLSVPTRFLIRGLADVFGVDAAELESVAKTDMFQRKYGEMSTTPIFNPEVAPFATAWHMLTDPQKNALLSQLKTFMSKNAAKAKTA